MPDRWSRLVGFVRGKLATWRAGDGRYGRALAVLLACLVCEAIYLFVASDGRWSTFQFMEARIDELAEAFRAGHLHLLREPDPQLLRRANPFDPANAALWYWDASLYGGHYYYYWGPVPALLFAAAKTILRVSRPMGDYVPLLGLATMQLVFGTVLIERLSRRLFPGSSTTAAVAAVLVFGLANPTPFILARPAIYEGAIVGGEAFVILGLLLAFEAVWAAQRVRRSGAYGAAAGAAFGLAVGCRVSMGPGLAVLAAAVAIVAARRASGRSWRRLLAMLAAVGVPFAALGALLLLYNRLRFDHWLEFGQRYQLNWIPWKWSPGFIAPNVYAYAWRPGVWSCRFPFVRAVMDMGAAAFPPGYQLPSGYFVYESLIGQLRGAPWMWLCPVAFVGRRGGGEGGLVSDRRAIAALLVIAGTLTFAPALFAPSATMRYLGDFSPVLVLLGCVGAWNLQRLAAHHRVALWSARVMLTLVGAATVCIGVALGTTGYYATFEGANPALYHRLEQRLSVCGQRP